MDGEATMTLANLITAILEVVTTLFENVGTVFTSAMSNPLVQIFLGIFFAGAIIGIGKRILNMI